MRNIAKKFKMTMSLIDIETVKPRYKCFFGEDVELSISVVDEDKKPLDLTDVNVKVYYTCDKLEPLRQDNDITINEPYTNGTIDILVNKKYLRLGVNTIRVALFDSDQEVLLQPCQINCIETGIGDEHGDVIVNDDINVKDEFIKTNNKVSIVDNRLKAVEGNIPEVKSELVDINEQLDNIEKKVNDHIESCSGGGTSIDDTTISTDRTWSSAKIEDFVHTNDDVVWSTVQGENLSVDYSKEGYLREVEIRGNTWQDDTDSKNLIDNNDGYILKGYSDDILNHKICTIEKSKMKVGTKYTLSTKTVLGSDARLNLYGMLDGTPTNICQMFSTTSRTITLDTDYDEYLLCAYAFANTESIGYKLEGVQLEEGDTATDYVDYHKADLSNIQHLGELYVDEEGQPILDGEGREQYKIEIKSCNANLFDGEMVNGESLSFIKIDSNKFNITLPTYKKSEGSIYFGYKVYNQNKDYIRTYWVGDNYMRSPAYTLNANETFIKFICDSDLRSQPIEITLSNLQPILAESNNITPLAPHKSHNQTILLPCQLMKVGDISDRLYWDSEKGKYVVEKKVDIPEGYDQLIDGTLVLETPQLIETNITKEILLPCYKDKTHLFVTGGIDGTIKAKIPLDGGQAIQSLSVMNLALNEEVSTLSLENEELKQMDNELVATSWDMDFRMCEIEWTLEDLGIGQEISTMSLENNIIKNTKGSVSNMALTRFEQAKIMIIGGVYNKETLTKQLTTYLNRGYLTQEEYDKLIALMEAKDLVVEE